MSNETRSRYKSIIGQLRKKYGLKDNTPIHKIKQIMTPEDWKAFSTALTFPNGKPTQEVDKLGTSINIFSTKKWP